MDTPTKHQISVFDDQGPASPFDANKAFPGLWISLGWIGMYFGLQLFFGGIAAAYAIFSNKKFMESVASGAAPDINEATLMAQMGLPLFVSVLISGLVALVILWLHLEKNNNHMRIGLFAQSKLSTGMTIGLGVALMIAAGLFGEAYGRFIVPGKELQAGVNQMIDAISKTPLNHVLLFVTIAIVAPVLEEILFRGYLQSALMHRMKPWLAILLASSLFGIVHMQPLAFPVLTVLGAVFGYLYYKTGSLKVNILLHILNNGVAYILMATGLSSGA
jgi:membrane protease YdiL (CAAX protease family)